MNVAYEWIIIGLLGNHLMFEVANGLTLVGGRRWQPRVVVNCGALSVPRMCEQDPEAAMAINIPRSVVEWLLSQDMSIPPLLIHLSSDQGKFQLAYKMLPRP
jgi:dTDP-4-dehydrorhamnose reductase